MTTTIKLVNSTFRAPQFKQLECYYRDLVQSKLKQCNSGSHYVIYQHFAKQVGKLIY